MNLLTRILCPIWRVGFMDPDGIWYGLTTKAWTSSASPTATATMTISSKKLPRAVFGLGMSGVSPFP